MMPVAQHGQTLAKMSLGPLAELFPTSAPRLVVWPRTQGRRSMVSRYAVPQVAAEEASTSGSSGIDWEAFSSQQRSMPRLSHADEARTLLDMGRTGMLSTVGSFGAWAGFPVGTVVEYACDERGRPIFAFSSLSSHTPDIKADPRCSLTVTAPGFKGMSDARVTIAGQVFSVAGEELECAKSAFKAKNPDSYWVDFGDFSWFLMDKIASARLVGGFGRIKQISAEEYAAASPDPVAKFSGPIAGHMNADHADSTVAMLQHYAGLKVEKASIRSLDRLGLDLDCVAEGQPFPCRLPFIRPAESRKDIKDVIVEMTRAAAAAAK